MKQQMQEEQKFSQGFPPWILKKFFLVFIIFTEYYSDNFLHGI